MASVVSPPELLSSVELRSDEPSSGAMPPAAGAVVTLRIHRANLDTRTSVEPLPPREVQPSAWLPRDSAPQFTPAIGPAGKVPIAVPSLRSSNRSATASQPFKAVMGTAGRKPVLPVLNVPMRSMPSLRDPHMETAPPAEVISPERIRTLWAGAPGELKLVTLLLPLLLLFMVNPHFGGHSKAQNRRDRTSNLGARIQNGIVDTVQGSATSAVKTAGAHLTGVKAGLGDALARRWTVVRENISNRAAIDLADDFRSGLDDWETQNGAPANWSYDPTGFVQPSTLALFRPSVPLTDYTFEFLALVDQRALGWVFRGSDLNNYYAMKLSVVKPGPLPAMELVRYAVIDGKQRNVVRRPLPMIIRSEMLYRISVEVRGEDFTTRLQGDVIDFWSDRRLASGGVGFFCGRGERARVRWLEVSHQADMLGRLCAYLGPYSLNAQNPN